MQSNEPYYASGTWGQEKTEGRNVLAELTVKYVAAIASHTDFEIFSYAYVVSTSISLAKETIKQLNREQHGAKIQEGKPS